MYFFFNFCEFLVVVILINLLCFYSNYLLEFILISVKMILIIIIFYKNIGMYILFKVNWKLVSIMLVFLKLVF